MTRKKAGHSDLFAVAGKVKRPVVVFFRKADQARIGLLEFDPRQIDRFGQ
jgi:hypothetical protein